MNENNRFFQWVAGERKGEILIFDKIEEDSGFVFIVFKDGSRINESLVGELNVKTLDGKLMCEVENSNNIWKFSENWVGKEDEKWEENGDGERVCVQPAIAGRKVINLIPPLNSKPTSSNFGTIVPQIVSTQPQLIIEPTINTDPVFIMLEKAKKSELSVNMSLTISVPSISLFNVIKESFEDGNNKSLEYIIDNIDINDIKAELKKGINMLYNGEEPISTEDPDNISEHCIEKGGTGIPE